MRNKQRLIIFFITISFLFLFVILPYPAQNLEMSYCPPNTKAVLGCSPLGEDMGSLIFWGAWQTIITAVSGRLLASFLSAAGFMIAYLGRQISYNVISRLSEAFMTIPSLMLALSLGFFWGAGQGSMILAIGISEWAFSQKWLLGRLKEYNRFLFTEASICAGAGRFHILKEHFFPFLSKDILFLFFIYFPTSLLSAAALEFLGLSSADKISGLGYQTAAYKDLIMLHPNLSLAPVFALLLIVSAALFLKARVTFLTKR